MEVWKKARDHRVWHGGRLFLNSVTEDRPPYWIPNFVVNGEVRQTVFLHRDFCDMIKRWMARQPIDKDPQIPYHYLWWALGVASVVTVQRLDDTSTVSRARDNGLDSKCVLEGMQALTAAYAHGSRMGLPVCHRISRNGRSFFYQNASHDKIILCVTPEIYELIVDFRREFGVYLGRQDAINKLSYMCGEASQRQPLLDLKTGFSIKWGPGKHLEDICPRKRGLLFGFIQA